MVHSFPPMLHWPDTLKQSIQLQVIEFCFPLPWSWQRYPPTSILHLLEQCDGLMLCILEIRCTDDEGGEVEQNERILGVDVMLYVVLPGIGR
jgi:hypothetical protein